LYCEATDSLKRRRTQTALFEVADALIRLISPVLCHTADEAYLSLHGLQEADELCVHLAPLSSAGWKLTLGKHWDSAMALRRLSLKALEDAKTKSGITNPLDAGIVARVRPT
jgi:isoleucyl-tRNA synthetase